jgi:DNA modification methylase
VTIPGVRPYYAADGVELYHEDALEIMSQIDATSVDVVLTDPPYSSGGRRENARSLRKSMNRATPDSEWIRGDAMSTQGFIWFMRECGIQWRRILVPGGHALSFIDWRMAPNLAAALESADLRQHPTIVWDKTYFGMGAVFRNQYELVVHMTAGNARPPQRRDVGNVIACKPVRSNDHPNEKPVPLLSTLLSVVCPPAGLVLDQCAGSGTTLMAAAALGLRAIGIENDERCCEVIAQRLAQSTADDLVEAKR